MRVAILDDYSNIALSLADWSPVSSRAQISVFDRPLSVPDEAAEVLKDFDVLCTLRERMPIPSELINRLPNLKHIVVTGVRYDTIDAEAAAKRGIPVSTTGLQWGQKPQPQASTSNPITELVWGLMIGLARDIARLDRHMRAGGWQLGPGIALKGKTLGILGLGKMGQEVARGGHFFGMNVQAWSENLTPEKAEAAGVKYVSRDESFATSDFLSVHLVLGDRTRGLVGARELGLMKPTAFLVNTARAAIIEEEALMNALQSGQIAGAGLDVYHQEPLPADHPLRSMQNVILSPHLGYFTEEAVANFYRGAVAVISAFLDGSPINVVNGDADK